MHPTVIMKDVVVLELLEEFALVLPQTLLIQLVFLKVLPVLANQIAAALDCIVIQFVKSHPTTPLVM